MTEEQANLIKSALRDLTKVLQKKKIISKNEIVYFSLIDLGKRISTYVGLSSMYLEKLVNDKTLKEILSGFVKQSFTYNSTIIYFQQSWKNLLKSNQKEFIVFKKRCENEIKRFTPLLNQINKENFEEKIDSGFLESMLKILEEIHFQNSLVIKGINKGPYFIRQLIELDNENEKKNRLFTLGRFIENILLGSSDMYCHYVCDNNNDHIFGAFVFYFNRIKTEKLFSITEIENALDHIITKFQKEYINTTADVQKNAQDTVENFKQINPFDKG